jgi:hypothetical protein
MKSVRLTPSIGYCNGEQHTIEGINVQSVFDDLFGRVVFRYVLLTKNGVQCGEGAYELNGEEQYTRWDASAESAYKIVIAGLGLEIAPTVGKSSIFEG